MGWQFVGHSITYLFMGDQKHSKKSYFTTCERWQKFIKNAKIGQIAVKDRYQTLFVDLLRSQSSAKVCTIRTTDNISHQFFFPNAISCCINQLEFWVGHRAAQSKLWIFEPTNRSRDTRKREIKNTTIHRLIEQTCCQVMNMEFVRDSHI